MKLLQMCTRVQCLYVVTMNCAALLTAAEGLMKLFDRAKFDTISKLLKQPQMAEGFLPEGIDIRMENLSDQ